MYTLYPYRMNKPKTRIAVLAAKLKENGVTQGKLAQWAGCTHVQMKKMISGESNLSEPYAVALATQTGASLHWLLGRDRCPPQVLN